MESSAGGEREDEEGQAKGLCQVGMKESGRGGRCVIDGRDLCLGRCCLFGYRRCVWGAYGCESQSVETAEAALPAYPERQRRHVLGIFSDLFLRTF